MSQTRRPDYVEAGPHRFPYELVFINDELEVEPDVPRVGLKCEMENEATVLYLVPVPHENWPAGFVYVTKAPGGRDSSPTHFGTGYEHEFTAMRAVWLCLTYMIHIGDEVLGSEDL